MIDLRESLRVGCNVDRRAGEVCVLPDDALILADEGRERARDEGTERGSHRHQPRGDPDVLLDPRVVVNQFLKNVEEERDDDAKGLMSKGLMQKD